MKMKLVVYEAISLFLLADLSISALLQRTMANKVPIESCKQY